MHNFLRNTLAVGTGLLLCCFRSGQAQAIEWPNGAKAAVCLTYDDAMSSQLDQAIPVLNAYKLKGTFFLNSISDDKAADQWRQASRKGHELANHTLFHPCLATKGWKPVWALENYTFDRILREVQSMNTQLFLLDGKRSKRTFAFPCGDTMAGGVSYLDTLQRSGLVSYGRMVGDARSVVTDFKTLDLFQVPSMAVQPSHTASDLIAFAEQAARQSGLSVYLFHGVGAQWIAVSASDHKKLAEYLAANKKTYWVTTFSEAMDYIADWKKTHPFADGVK